MNVKSKLKKILFEMKTRIFIGWANQQRTRTQKKSPGST